MIHTERVKKARLKLGISQTELAKHLNLTSPQFVSNWERGISGVPDTLISDVCNFLKINPMSFVNAKVKDYKIRILKTIRRN